MYESNHPRVRVWQEIKLNILGRIRENNERLSRCRDVEVLPILKRIAADDEARLREAERWVVYHRGF